MTDRLVSNWDLEGFVDEQRYYCSETPIDPLSPPTPKAVLAGDVRTYIDSNIEVGKTYYVAVGSVKNGVEKFGDEIIVTTLQSIFIDASSVANTTSTQSLTLSAPIAQIGDMICVALVVRSDRSITAPPGFVLVKSIVVGNPSFSASQKLKLNIYKKQYQNENSYTFAQSVSAAIQGVIFSVRDADIINVATNIFGGSFNYQKVNASSSFIVLSVANSFGGNAAAEQESLDALDTAQAGFTALAQSFYHTGSSNDQYYYFIKAIKSDPTQLQNLSLSYSSLQSTSGVFFQSITIIEIN